MTDWPGNIKIKRFIAIDVKWKCLIMFNSVEQNCNFLSTSRPQRRFVKSIDFLIPKSRFTIFIEEAFLVRDNRVFNGPLGRSLRLFARTAHSAHSAHSLRSAPLRYARFARLLRSQARSLTSLTLS